MATVPTEKPKQMTIRDHLQSDAFKAQLASVVPSHCRPERMARVALTAITRNPTLADCDRASFFQALLSLSEWGLEPNGRDAHLIPFRNNKRDVTECQLIIDYKGYCKLCYQNPRVRNIHADVVYEGDDFEINLGQVVRHVPWAFRRDTYKPAERGDCIAAYARVELAGASPKCEVMTYHDIEAVRQRSRASNAGPWVTDWAEMAKKTAFRRCVKWLPISPELTDAMERDDDAPESFIRTAEPRLRGMAALETLTQRLEPPTTDWDGDVALQLADCATNADIDATLSEWVAKTKPEELARLSELCDARRKELKPAKQGKLLDTHENAGQ